MIVEHIDIKPVCLKDLYAFAKDFEKEKKPGQVIPITVNRARSQMKNPYAAPDDVVLFTAWHGKKCVGYIGLLPGILAGKNKRHRILWGSTFYLADEYRGKGIGKMLLEQLRCQPLDFVVTRITPGACRLLIRFGMKTLGRLHYFQLRVEKIHVLKKIFDIFNHSDKFQTDHGLRRTEWKNMERYFFRLEKRIFYGAALTLMKKKASPYKAVKVSAISRSDYFDSHQQPPNFFRGPQVINWMLQNKWITSGKNDSKTGVKYHFSASRRLFSYTAIKLFSGNNKKYLGFMIFSVAASKGKTILKVLDHSLEGVQAVPAALAVSLAHAADHRADRLELPEKLGDYLMKHVFFHKFLKKQKRRYIYYSQHKNSPLERVKGKIRLDYCDGDTAFT